MKNFPCIFVTDKGNHANYINDSVKALNIDYDIQLIDYSENTITFSITNNNRLSVYKFNLLKNKSGRGFDYAFVKGTPLDVNISKDQKNIIELFYGYPPVVWVHENSKIYNDLLFPFRYNVPLFDISKMKKYIWDGVDIRKESQKKTKRSDSIQYKVIQDLKKETDYSIIFDDDDANEASDIIAIKSFASEYNKLVINLFHCKYSVKETPGCRLDDLYEVCGQAQRSYHWRHNIIALLEHMIRRNNNRVDAKAPSRYEKGGVEELHTIMHMVLSKYCDIEFKYLYCSARDR